MHDGSANIIISTLESGNCMLEAVVGSNDFNISIALR
jgi:hypothetical protein